MRRYEARDLDVGTLNGHRPAMRLLAERPGAAVTSVDTPARKVTRRLRAPVLILFAGPPGGRLSQAVLHRPASEEPA